MLRGFSAVGLVRPKTAENVGGVMRAAYGFEASMVAIESSRALGHYMGHPTDTPHAWMHIPTLHGPLRGLLPHDCVPVAVDLVDDAEPLPSFQHPARAMYIFGPEDGTLGPEHLSWCARRVMIPMRNCMNLAACVNVVLYDRRAKAERHARGVRYNDLGMTA